MKHEDIDHTGLTGAGGSVATDVIWDAAGDSVWGTGANTGARLAYGSNGRVVTGVAGTGAWATPPGFEFNYAQVTASVSVTNSAVASADTLVTAGAVTMDGATNIEVQFGAPFSSIQATSGVNLILYLFEDGTNIGIIWQATNNASVTLRTGGIYTRTPVRPPASGSRTYSVRATSSAGTSSVGGGIGGNGQYRPMYIRIVRT